MHSPQQKILNKACADSNEITDQRNLNGGREEEEKSVIPKMAKIEISLSRKIINTKKKIY